MWSASRACDILAGTGRRPCAASSISPAMKFRIIAVTTALLALLSPCFSKAADTARQAFDSAMQAMQAGDFARAEAGFRRVLQLDPGNVGALADLGIVYSRTHRYTEAIDE